MVIAIFLFNIIFNFLKLLSWSSSFFVVIIIINLLLLVVFAFKWNMAFYVGIQDVKSTQNCSVTLKYTNLLWLRGILKYEQSALSMLVKNYASHIWALTNSHCPLIRGALYSKECMGKFLGENMNIHRLQFWFQFNMWSILLIC